MSDTGSTKFPDGPKLAGSTPKSSELNVLNARLIGVPNATKGVENKIVRLQGNVLSQNDTGRVRIQTEKGPVEIQLPKDSPLINKPLNRGQRVEIEIPPEKVRLRNAESVQIRTSKTETSPNTQKSRSAESNPKSDTQNQQQLRGETSTSSPKKIDSVDANTRIISQSEATTQRADIIAKTSLPLQSLEGKTIRLDPLPPNLSAKIITPDIQVLPQRLTSNTSSSQLPPQVNISTEQTGQITTLLKSELPTATLTIQSANTILNQGLTESSQGENLNAPSTITNNQTLSLDGSIFKQNTLAQSSESKGTIPFFKVPTSPSFMNENLQGLQNFKTQSFSAEIQTIKPPAILLTAPNAQANAIQAQNLQQQGGQILSGQNNISINQNQIGTQTGFIIGKTLNNLPVITIPAPNGEAISQNFILQTPVRDAAMGARVEFSPQGASTISAQSVAMTGFLPPPGYFLIPDQWPLMEDVLQNLRQSSAQVAQAFTASIPNAATPAQLGPAALFFMAALHAGDLSSILGEKAQDILRGQGKGGLLSRLMQEGNIINRLGAEPVSQDWRSVTLPMAWENEIHKIALHYKHEYHDSEDNDKGSKQTRFIFDLSLSRMGSVQVDGLHRENRLNLIIRTEEPLSRAMQITMKDGYNSALEETRLSGDLSFQNNLDSWVKVSAKKDDHYNVDI